MRKATVVDMAGTKHVGEAALAWALAEVVRPRLTRELKTRLFTKLGAGEAHTALLSLLDYCSREGIAVPANTVTALCDWVGGYAGTEIETVLRPCVERIVLRAEIGDAEIIGQRGRSGSYLLPLET